jgi:hypothetical protein
MFLLSIPDVRTEILNTCVCAADERSPRVRTGTNRHERPRTAANAYELQRTRTSIKRTATNASEHERSKTNVNKVDLISVISLPAFPPPQSSPSALCRGSIPTLRASAGAGWLGQMDPRVKPEDDGCGGWSGCARLLIRHARVGGHPGCGSTGFPPSRERRVGSRERRLMAAGVTTHVAGTADLSGKDDAGEAPTNKKARQCCRAFAQSGD